MKKSETKKKLVQELADFHRALNVEQLYCWPKHKTTKDWLADVAAIFKNLDKSDHREFVRLSKTIAPTEEREKRKKAANEIDAFTRRKVAEWKRHDFSDLDRKEVSHKGKTVGILNKGEDNVFDLNRFSGLDIGIQDEGKKTKARKNIFQGSGETRESTQKTINYWNFINPFWLVWNLLLLLWHYKLISAVVIILSLLGIDYSLAWKNTLWIVKIFLGFFGG